jgi:hypothetical protein
MLDHNGFWWLLSFAAGWAVCAYRYKMRAIAERRALASAGVISGDDARRLEEEMARNSAASRRDSK